MVYLEPVLLLVIGMVVMGVVMKVWCWLWWLWWPWWRW